MAEPVVKENETIAGKYRVERTIGEGGMGVVVAATHLELDHKVAIKFLRPEIAGEGSSAERFRREARAAAKIRSEHVCRVLDVGTLESGVPYLVMEYLEGCDLSDELTRRGHLPIEEAVDYVLQACEALAEAHAAGIVHRDLKPGNLFLSARADGSRSVKVLDFGVSKSLLEPGSGLRLTKTATLVGSPLYMSPEQLEAKKDVDPRADVWALGTILFELVTGRTPFQADTMPQLVHAVMSTPAPSFAEMGVSVPPGLEDVVRGALTKQREVRLQTVAVFARALVPFGPAHAMASAARAERVLSSSADARPLDVRASPVTVGRTPVTDAEKADPLAAKTLESSGPDVTLPLAGARTSRGEVVRRRGGYAAVALLAAAVFVSTVALLRKPADGPAPTAAPSSAAVAEQPSVVPPVAETAAPSAAALAAVPGPAESAERPSASAVSPIGIGPVVSAAAKAPAGPASPGASRKPRSEAKGPPEPEGLSDFGGRR
jgi:eukaryotic-like serine/threonine-protein kinase